MQNRTYPVKVINWGYWGNVGIVADEGHNDAMERMGIGSIEPKEGSEILRAFLDSDLKQIGVVKVSESGVTPAEIDPSESLKLNSRAAGLGSPRMPGNTAANVSTDRLEAMQQVLQDAPSKMPSRNG